MIHGGLIALIKKNDGYSCVVLNVHKWYIMTL